MLIFLAGLWSNPVARKFIIYGAAGLAILYALRLWGNHQWQKGEHQGRIATSIEMEKAKKAEWKAAEAHLAAGAAQLAADRQTVDAQKTDLERSRRMLQDSLSRSLNQISLTREVNNAKVVSLPADQLDAALRSVSAELAAGAAAH